MQRHTDRPRLTTDDNDDWRDRADGDASSRERGQERRRLDRERPMRVLLECVCAALASQTDVQIIRVEMSTIASRGCGTCDVASQTAPLAHTLGL